MATPIRSTPTDWQTVVLLCGKCARKMEGGYGPDRTETLKQALRGELRATGRRRAVRLVETRCLGICPKKAVVAVNASRPDRFLEVPKGTEAAAALDQLLSR